MSPAEVADMLGNVAGPTVVLVIAVRFYLTFDRRATDRINEAEKDTAAARIEADAERGRRIAAEETAARLEARAAGLEAQIEALRGEIARLRLDIAALRGETTH